MHCYFVLAGDSSIPVLYHVERVREGKSFMTRTVQARQRGRCIFTTTLSFVREGSAGREVVEHEVGLPAGAREELEGIEREMERERREESEEERWERESFGAGEERGPFESRRFEVTNSMSHLHPTSQQIRGGLQTSLSIIPYIPPHLKLPPHLAKPLLR